MGAGHSRALTSVVPQDVMQGVDSQLVSQVAQMRHTSTRPLVQIGYWSEPFGGVAVRRLGYLPYFCLGGLIVSKLFGVDQVRINFLVALLLFHYVRRLIRYSTTRSGVWAGLVELTDAQQPLRDADGSGGSRKSTTKMSHTQCQRTKFGDVAVTAR